MNNACSKVFPLWIILFILIALCGCTETIDDPLGHAAKSDAGSVLVRIPELEVETTANVTSIELFQFSDGVFVQKISVDPSKENTVEFPRLHGMRIFALAAHSIEAGNPLSESDFSSLTISMPKDSHSAPVFFSSVSEIPESSTRVDIEPRRAVSRLDIANEDPDLKIEKVCISGAASSSHVFPMDGRTCECSCSIYSRYYEEGIDGVAERAFILFETSAPVSVTVKGIRKGVPVEMTAETPVIERNNHYTVTIYKENTGGRKDRDRAYTDDDFDSEDILKTIIKVRDWETGDVKNASIDFEESAIDIGKSYIPDGVRIDSSDNSVTVSPEGVKGMRLSFSTKSILKLGSVISDTEGVRVTPLDPKTTGDGYICDFLVDVAKQPKCAGRYQTYVFFNGSSDFYINVVVEPSPYQVPTVRIGGHEWMCFNAVSQDPEEQIFLPKGTTVEKMYTESFVKCVGNFFQYGRPNPFSPWTASDPNKFADQKRDSPWTTRSMMPLPKGFHVASAKEWEDLIPSGTVIPSTYTTPYGEKIKASLYTYPGALNDSPSAATNAMNYAKRCVLLESLTTGAKLCLPMCGMKTNVGAEIPTDPNFRFGTRSGYWMKEYRNVMILQYERQGDGSEGIQLERNSWHQDGFVMIRGVRD